MLRTNPKCKNKKLDNWYEKYYDLTTNFEFEYKMYICVKYLNHFVQFE